MAGEKPTYVQINRKVWNTAQFRGLSREARELFFYLTTCPHGNMLGLFVLRPGYALDDLQWGTDRERFHKPLRELLSKHLFKYDAENEVVFDLEQITKHPPENPNQVTWAIKIINSLPRTPLFRDVKLLVEQLGKPFMEPLVKRLGERYAKPETETETETEAEGGVGETKPKEHLPVDNSKPADEDCPPFEPPKTEPEKPKQPAEKEPKKPKPTNTHGERWTDEQGATLEELMQDIAKRYGSRYHQQVYVFVQSNFNKRNPDGVLHCLRRLISDRLAGKPIPLPGKWLEAVLNGNGKQAGENGKFEARESERQHEELKRDESRDVGKLIGGIGRPM